MISFLLNMVTFILVIIVNIFSEILPLNDQTTGEVSNKIDVLITPSGFTFWIWILIYILCGIWVFRHFPYNRINLKLYQKSSPYFIISNILNCTWVFLWHYEQFFASVIVIMLLLLTLIVLYMTIQKTEHSSIDLVPFSLYLGWISIATLVNIAYYLKYIGWNGFGIPMTLWAILTLIVMVIITFYFAHIRMIGYIHLLLLGLL